MSKVKEDYKKEAKKVNKPTNKEVIKSLQEQKEQHLKQANYHNKMAIKAEGAIEILEQLGE
jgi:hypothetical protein